MDSLKMKSGHLGYSSLDHAIKVRILASHDPGEDRAVPSVDEEPDPIGQLLCTRRVDRKDPGVGGLLQSPAVSRGYR